MAQTTIQKRDALRFGSVVLEVGPDFGSLVNLGAIRDMKFNHKGEQIEIKFDNTESIKYFKNGQKASLTFLLAEIDLTTFSLTDDGLVEVTNVAAAPVAGATQTIAANSVAEKQFVEIENQMGDGTAPTINSVTGATDGALAANNDYYLIKNAQGKWGIHFVLAGSTLTTMNQVFTINYDYTPNASKKMTFNDFGQKNEMVAKITNTNNDGKQFIIKFTNITNLKNLTMPFLADDADDVATIEMELEGYVLEVIDEQSVT